MGRISATLLLAVSSSFGGCVVTPAHARDARTSTVIPAPVVRPEPASTGSPTVAVRSHIEVVDDNPPELEILDDASTGFPAMSRDGRTVAVLEVQDDLAQELGVTVAIFPAKGGSAFERLVVVSSDEARDGQRHRGKLLPIVERRTRALNQRLRDDGYASMPRQECPIEATSVRIDDVAAALDGGRFRVTSARGDVRLNVDASAWQRPPIRTPSFTCVTHPAIKWVAYDRARRVVVVEITHRIEEGGDSCPTPSSFGVFSL
jgi:hypothetical protein